MPTPISEGTQTSVIGTEHTLSTDTSNRTYVLAVDTSAMLEGDILELRLYTIVRSGGSERVAYKGTFANAQSDPNAYSVPVPADISIKATLKQIAGSARSYPWKLISIA